MESLVAQRIKSVLEAKQISISAFSKMIGMQQVTCNRQLRGDQAVSLGLIEGFLNEFDEISAEWLLRGHGKQLIEEQSFLVAVLRYSIHFMQNFLSISTILVDSPQNLMICFFTFSMVLLDSSDLLAFCLATFTMSNHSIKRMFLLLLNTPAFRFFKSRTL